MMTATATATETETTGPSIYVACLAAYNNGRLHGAWINVDDAESIHDAIQAMLKASPEPDADEYAIHAYEGFGRYSVPESVDFTALVTIAELIEEHGEFLFTSVLEYFWDNLEDATEAMNDNYHGVWKSRGDYVAEFYADCNEIPDALESYIDWDSMARDWEINGDIFTIETGYEEVHVFSGH